MTKFDRHIIRRFLTGYLVLTAALIVFFVVLHYVEFVDDFMDRGATLRQVFLTYYPAYIPEIVKLTSPLATFIACVHLTGRLAQSLQLSALQTSGVSLYRLMVPYMLVGIVITAGVFMFNGWVVPKSNQVVLEFEQEYLRDGPRQLDISDIHRQNSPRSVIIVGYYDKNTNIGHRATLEEFQGDQLTSRIDADRLEWRDEIEKWRLRNVVMRTFDSSGLEERTTYVQIDTTLNVFPRDFARTERDVESMTIPAAGEYVESLKRSGADNLGRTMVNYFSKFSYPFANFILVILGVPLAAVRRRGGQAIQLGLGLLFAFCYLAVMKVIEPFGYSEMLSPVVTAWFPHALFAVVALVVLARTRK